MIIFFPKLFLRHLEPGNRTPPRFSTPEVDVDVGLDVGDEVDELADDLLLVGPDGGVHALDLVLRVALDPRGNVAAGADVAGLVLLELLLALACGGTRYLNF